MTFGKLSDKNNFLKVVPVPQSPAVAGFIQSHAGTVAPSGWLALNTNSPTTIANAANLYPDLYSNVNPNWHDGQDIRVPQGEGVVKWPSYDDLDVTITATGLAQSDTYFKPYIDDSGKRRVTFNFRMTGTNITNATMIISGILFLGGSNQAVSAGQGGVGDGQDVHTVANSGNISYIGANTSSEVYVSGDVELNDWPSWATKSTEALPIIKLYNDQANVAVSDVEATSVVAGILRRNSYIQNGDQVTYDSADAGTAVLLKNSIPQGKYKVTIGFFRATQQPNTNALMKAVLNGSDVTLNGTTWFIGLNETGSLAGEQGRLMGVSCDQIIDFPNPANSFGLDFLISGSSTVERPYYILEKLENSFEITNEWD